MKIYFSPEYSGHVYLTSDNTFGVMMDTVAVNTIGLVCLLELRLGLHYDDVLPHERTARYFDAMKRYIDRHPESVLAASFRTSGLSTAIAVLDWRDELRMAGWKFTNPEISKRIAAIIGIEEFLREGEDTDFVERLQSVTAQLKEQKLDCSEMEILLPIEVAMLRPAERQLVESIVACGAKVSLQPIAQPAENNLSAVRTMIAKGGTDVLKLDEKDESLLVWKFADEHAAHEYLAYREMKDVDVWINADNKAMDDYLMRMHRPITGSNVMGGTHPLSQLFLLGISMFLEPLDIKMLIEWLSMPLHPLNTKFCRRLTAAIASNGGYRNEKCRAVIKSHIDGADVYLDYKEKELPEEEQEKLRRKDARKREKLVETFLPPLERSEKLEIVRLQNFASAFSAWCRQRIHCITSEKYSWLEDKKTQAEQLGMATTMSDAFLLLLHTVNGKWVDTHTVESWISTIYASHSVNYDTAISHCRIVIDSPEKLASVAGTTIWMGVEDDEAQRLDCDFLYPSEREALTAAQAFLPWEEDRETHYHETMSHMALTKTQRQLILVVCERRNGDVTPKHPLIVRLEKQISNFKDFVRWPSFDKDDFEEVKKPQRINSLGEIHIPNADLLHWPDHLSPTQVEQLVLYPLDYVMQNLLDITSDVKVQLGEIKTTMGNVAHAVIAALFAPREGENYSTAAQIDERIQSSYDETFRNVIEGNGAILQLQENRLNEKLLREKLRLCIENLQEILAENELRVTGCERRVEAFMDLGLPRKEDEDKDKEPRDMLGYIDMTLEDSAGRPVIIDFKWTSSKSYHKRLLEGNRSIQLALYSYMLGREYNKKACSVAYFLMPEGRLFSTSSFRGRHCTQVTADNGNDIVKQLRNSILYRKRQISAGIIETNGTFDQLQYVKDTEEQGLFPLIEDENEPIKKENIFSDYPLFYF